MIGAVLAGGRGERLGGAKALVELEGRPLIAHAIDALRPLVGEVVVVAKPGTPLPDDLDVGVWHDEQEDFHPRHGIVTALRRTSPVLVVAVDLPRAAPALKALLLVGPTSVARAERLQPLCGLYDGGALATFEAAPDDEPLTRTVERLSPIVVDVPAAWLRNINRREDL